MMPSEGPVETYKGVLIEWYDDIQALDTLEYGAYNFLYGNRREAYSTLQAAKDRIDDLIDMEVPPMPRFIETYKGHDIYLDQLSGEYFSPAIPASDRRIIVIQRAIDDVVAAERPPPTEEEEPTEEPEIIQVELVEAPALPWYVAWLEPMLQYIGGLVENVVNYASARLAGLKEPILALGTLPADLLKAGIDGMGDLLNRARDTSAEAAAGTFKEAMIGSPAWMQDLEASLAEQQGGMFDIIDRALSDGAVSESEGAEDTSIQRLEELKGKILQVAIANFTLHALVESGSLGQIEFMKDIDPMIVSKFGLDEIVRKATLLPIERAVLTPAEYAYNERFPHVIPTASDLINMVVKEVIPLDEFKAQMLKLGFPERWSQAIWDAHFIAPDYTQITQALYRGAITREQYESLKRLVDLDERFDNIWDSLIEQVPPMSELINERVKEVIDQATFTKYMSYYGLSPEWSERIWAAHFIPPTLGDLLTSWRRGVISTEQLDELMIIVDLDPRFKDIFDTRRYVDPSISEARFMFETGAIDEARVREIVLRNGFTEADTTDIVQWIVRFQERRFRTSYLLSLATGAIYGAYTAEELIQEVTDAGYTEAVASWILKAAEARHKTSIARARKPSPRLLTTGDVKKAFIRDVINEDQLRTELATRSYPLSDIDILVTLLNEDKVTTEAGGRKVALSQSELLNAWRYDQLNEDSLRIELSLRGLSEDEVDILLATKRRQWGLE